MMDTFMHVVDRLVVYIKKSNHIVLVKVKGHVKSPLVKCLKTLSQINLEKCHSLIIFFLHHGCRLENDNVFFHTALVCVA